MCNDRSTLFSNRPFKTKGLMRLNKIKQDFLMFDNVLFNDWSIEVDKSSFNKLHIDYNECDDFEEVLVFNDEYNFDELYYVSLTYN